MSFFSELQRRNVIRVAAFYLVAAWLVIQVAETVLPLFAVPEALLRGLVVLLAIGFVPTLVFAWVFELTPDGIRRDAGPETGGGTRRGQRLNLATTAVAIVAIALFAWDRFAAPEAPLPAVPQPADLAAPAPGATPAIATPETAGVSIAVLPFANMSGNPDNEYFSDGLTDTLLHVLAKVPELRVAARTSSFKFKDKAEDVAIIGEQLRVGHVLEGSVQRAGDRVRITAQLVKTDDGYHVWTETFDRTLDDIFEVQDEIARRVVGALTETLLGAAPVTETVDPAIFDDYLRAQALVNSREARNLEEAVTLLETIVGRAPEFGRGYSLLSRAYGYQIRYGYATAEETVPLVVAAAERAVALAPNDAESHRALGQARRSERRWNDMMVHLETAYELEPNNAEVLASYAEGLQRMTRMREALPIIRRAVLLDPLNIQLKPRLSRAYLYNNDLEASVEVLESALEASPDDPDLLSELAYRYEDTGQWAKSIRTLERWLSAHPESYSALRSLYGVYFDLGDYDTAEAILDRLMAVAEYQSLDEAASLCRARGDLSCWLAEMQRMLEVRSIPGAHRGHLAYAQGRIDDAIGYFEERVKTGMEQGNDRIAMTMAELASLHHRQGRFEERDEYIALGLAEMERHWDEGIEWVLLTKHIPALLAAARGDAPEAYRLASAANREGPPIGGAIVNRFVVWDVIRDTPEFAQLMVEVREREAEVLAEVKAAATWDPRESAYPGAPES